MKPTRLSAVLFSLFSLALYPGMTQAFSFDFGDGYDHPPTWIETYGQPAPRYYYFPQMRSFDRSRMIDRRQERMERKGTTMDQLTEQLSGRYAFDREKAIKLARDIEYTASHALSRDFHPGAIIDSDSRTTRAYWGNEQIFRQHAEALQDAAKALAEELAKEPTAEEGVVHMRVRGKYGDSANTVPVSSKVWQKYSDVSNTCHTCHRSFRSPFW